jgi:hypothetical protein
MNAVARDLQGFPQSAKVRCKDPSVETCSLLWSGSSDARFGETAGLIICRPVQNICAKVPKAIERLQIRVQQTTEVVRLRQP